MPVKVEQINEYLFSDTEGRVRNGECPEWRTPMARNGENAIIVSYDL